MRNEPWISYVKALVAEYPHLGDSERDGRVREAVEAAARETAGLAGGDLRLKLIDMVFWRQSHTLGGAALALPCHVNTAGAWQKEFLRLVAKGLGLP